MIADMAFIITSDHPYMSITPLETQLSSQSMYNHEKEPSVTI